MKTRFFTFLGLILFLASCGNDGEETPAVFGFTAFDGEAAPVNGQTASSASATVKAYCSVNGYV